MKILHTIDIFGAKSGGTSTCTYDLLKSMQNNHDTINILTPTTIDPDDKLMGTGEEWIIPVTNDYKSPLAYSKNLKDWIKKSQYDIYHTNGLWLYVNHLTCKYARAKGKPYLISPHGMLYPAALHRNYWKKWPILKIWFKKDIMNASCIHVTCEQELEYIRDFGYQGPVALIPNPVGIPEYVDNILSKPQKRISDYKTTIGFLGRLHPRKNVEGILKGLHVSKRKDVEVLIMGKGEREYELFLKSEANRLELSSQVKFLGFVKGKEKYEILASIDALFVPSDFENFGMIIAEALLMKTPVMASLGTPWKELNTEHCGWWCERSPESIAKIIDIISSSSKERLASMGEKGHNLIISKYSENKVAHKMWQLYAWIGGSSEKPDFIYT